MKLVARGRCLTSGLLPSGQELRAKAISVQIIAVHIPPQANAKLALHSLLSSQPNAHPEGVAIVEGDFNHVELKADFQSSTNI